MHGSVSGSGCDSPGRLGSRGGKGLARSGQVTFEKKNESEPPFFMSKSIQTISKPRFVRRLRDKFRRDLFTGGTVSGI
jgi:hypothetical protein